MDAALQYLRKYLAEPSVQSTLRSDDPILKRLPEWWRRVLAVGGEQRIRETLKAWEGFRTQMPSVFSILSRQLRNVTLLTDKNNITGQVSVRLLYEVERSDGRTLYYTGGNPIEKSMFPSVRSAWSKLPADFRRFYDSHHNGWYFLASNSMGPSPAEDFFILNDLEWGILDDIGDPGCDLTDLVAVYTNGMGGYVALGIEGNGDYGDVLWWKDKPPRLNIDAWAVIDAWTEIGLSK